MEDRMTSLRAWRLANGLTVREVGDLAGLHASTVNRVERGTRSLAPMQKVLVARRLGVSISDLFPVDPEETSDAVD